MIVEKVEKIKPSGKFFGKVCNRIAYLVKIAYNTIFVVTSKITCMRFTCHRSEIFKKAQN